MGELKQAFDPHSGAVVWVKGKTCKAESETDDLWQPKWSENQTVLAQPHIPQTGTQVPWEGTATGSWSLGIVGQSLGERF